MCRVDTLKSDVLSYNNKFIKHIQINFTHSTLVIGVLPSLIAVGGDIPPKVAV